MEKAKWTDGWHEDSESLAYLVEAGCIKRGVRTDHNGQKAVYPYIKSKRGGYDLKTDLKANKRNFERIYWF